MHGGVRGGSGGGAWLRGGGAWLCGAEVHGWHALESCGLLSLVRVSRRGKQTPRKLNARDEGCAFNLCVFVHLRNIGCRTPELVLTKAFGVKKQNVAQDCAAAPLSWAQDGNARTSD